MVPDVVIGPPVSPVPVPTLETVPVGHVDLHVSPVKQKNCAVIAVVEPYVKFSLFDAVTKLKVELPPERSAGVAPVVVQKGT